MTTAIDTTLLDRGERVEEMNNRNDQPTRNAKAVMIEFLKVKQHKTTPILLTPELARLLLERRVEGMQRPVIAAHVAFLTHAIKTEAWQPYNGDTICLSVSGKLIDGQHRCLAVLESEIAVETDIALAVPDISFHSKGFGYRGRTVAEEMDGDLTGLWHDHEEDEATECAAYKLWWAVIGQPPPADLVVRAMRPRAYLVGERS